jgi:hypothetical protein
MICFARHVCVVPDSWHIQWVLGVGALHCAPARAMHMGTCMGYSPATRQGHTGPTPGCNGLDANGMGGRNGMDGHAGARDLHAVWVAHLAVGAGHLDPAAVLQPHDEVGDVRLSLRRLEAGLGRAQHHLLHRAQLAVGSAGQQGRGQQRQCRLPHKRTQQRKHRPCACACACDMGSSSNNNTISMHPTFLLSVVL